MSEVCGICSPQTQSTVTRSVHQNSGFHSRELVTKTRKGETGSWKPAEAQSGVSSPRAQSWCLWGHGVCWHPGPAARDRGTRKWLTESRGHRECGTRHRRFRHPSVPRRTTEGQPTFLLRNVPKNGWLHFGLSSLIFCQSRESSFVFVGTPKCAGPVQILLGAGGLAELPTLGAELNYLCHSNFVSLFPQNGEFVHLRLEKGGTRSLSCLLQPVLTGTEGSGGPKCLSNGESPGRWSPSPLEPQQFASLLNHKGWTLFSFHSVPWTGL